MTERSESLIDNRFVSVRRTLGRPGLVRVVRTTLPIETLEQVDEVWGAVSRTLIPLDRARHVLLMDMRDAPGRNDDAFERRVAKYRSATVQGFLRVAVLVRSLPGQLQVQRHAREDGLGMVHIFASEPAALEWLTNG
ncbi:MAG: hypothetical protein RL685_4789 [Pseudomonadota bacterium]|jgi:hypothetical protein